MSDAVVIYKNYRKAGGVFDTKATGFVLTVPKIEAYLRLEQLKNPDFVAEEVKKARAKVA